MNNQRWRIGAFLALVVCSMSGVSNAQEHIGEVISGAPESETVPAEDGEIQVRRSEVADLSERILACEKLSNSTDPTEEQITKHIKRNRSLYRSYLYSPLNSDPETLVSNRKRARESLIREAKPAELSKCLKKEFVPAWSEMVADEVLNTKGFHRLEDATKWLSELETRIKKCDRAITESCAGEFMKDFRENIFIFAMEGDKSRVETEFKRTRLAISQMPANTQKAFLDRMDLLSGYLQRLIEVAQATKKAKLQL